MFDVFAVWVLFIKSEGLFLLRSKLNEGAGSLKEDCHLFTQLVSTRTDPSVSQPEDRFPKFVPVRKKSVTIAQFDAVTKCWGDAFTTYLYPKGF